MTSRVTPFRALALLALSTSLLVTGCNGGAKTQAKTPSETASTEVAPLDIRIGTLPTEDSLPLWVAESKGYFTDAGLPAVEIVVFQSAQERDTAFASGAIDAFMGDIIAAANLEAAGSGVTLATVMLGADQSQGRFGIAVPPKSKVSTLSALAGVPVGTSSATIQEFVLDGLMAEAGVATSSVKVEEVKKVPVRFELLMAGKLKAAALPEPFLSLAKTQGAVVLADDTQAEANLSQTVLGVGDDYVADAGGQASVDAVLSAWDKAIADINADPEAYRQMLVDKARLPEPLKASYEVNQYPAHEVPAQADVDAVLEWMKTKGYLKTEVGYADLTPLVAK